MRMPEISAEYMIAVGVRSGLGLIFGFFMGITALIVSFWVLPGLYTPPFWMILIIVSIGCTASAFLAYFKPETTSRTILVSLLVAAAGAYIGAWIGFAWGEIFYPEGVRNVRLLAYGDVRSPPVIAFITWSTLGSTVSGGIYYVLRAWRYHEV